MAIILSGIHIYPVKALGGITLDQSVVTPRGLCYDRRFMVVDANGDLVTQREHPKMATVWMDINGDELTLASPYNDFVSIPLCPPAGPPLPVRVWSSKVTAQPVSAEADHWMSHFLGVSCRLAYMSDSCERAIDPAYAKAGEVVSFADGYPLLIAAEESLADLNTRIVSAGGSAIPMSRFRPNLVINGCEPFAEDRLGEIRVGEAIFRAVKPCARCQVTTTDQASGEVRGPEPLRTLGTFRDSPSGPLFGMNLIPVRPATVRMGDAVTLA